MTDEMSTTGNSWFGEGFGDVPLMAILRGMGATRSLELATIAWDLGVQLVEIPVQHPADHEALAAVVRAGRERGRVVGAGTVIDAETVRIAAEVGAAFTVSPGLDLDVVRASAAAGMPSLPGVATASEMQLAQRAGLTWVKAFPASVLGPDWFAAMRAPFPAMNFVATGGMDAGNAARFLDVGVKVVAVGSALADPTELSRLAEVMAR